MARKRVRGVFYGIGYLPISARNSMPKVYFEVTGSHTGRTISSSLWYREQCCSGRRIRTARDRLVFRSRTCVGGRRCHARPEDRARNRRSPVLALAHRFTPNARPIGGVLARPTGGCSWQEPRAAKAAFLRNEDGFAVASSRGTASASARAYALYNLGFTDRPRETVASTLRSVRVNSDRRCCTCAASFGSERKAVLTRKRFKIAVTGRLSECCKRKAVICRRISMRSSGSSSGSFVTTKLALSTAKRSRRAEYLGATT